MGYIVEEYIVLLNLMYGPTTVNMEHRRPEFIEMLLWFEKHPELLVGERLGKSYHQPIKDLDQAKKYIAYMLYEPKDPRNTIYMNSNYPFECVVE